MFHCSVIILLHFCCMISHGQLAVCRLEWQLTPKKSLWKVVHLVREREGGGTDGALLGGEMRWREHSVTHTHTGQLKASDRPILTESFLSCEESSVIISVRLVAGAASCSMMLIYAADRKKRL